MKRKALPMIHRRGFLALVSSFTAARATENITYPVISEDACPLQRITPTTKDGHQEVGFVRKPPGKGPFPVFMIIHPPGAPAAPWPEGDLKTYVTTPTPSRFLAAGYVLAVPNYRGALSEAEASRADVVAAVDYLKGLPFADPKSIIVYGCSGGGSHALEAASATELCGIVAEEPASMMFTGILDSTGLSKKANFTPADGAPISQDPKRYYTDENQKLTRAKIDRIRCPILIIQGDVQPVNRFNAQVLIPELRSAGKKLDVITYPGAVHCFCTQGGEMVDGRNGRWRRTPPGPWTLQETAALKAFHDINAFCKQHVPTQPKPVDFNRNDACHIDDRLTTLRTSSTNSRSA